jgi:hypothetical protein
MYKLGNKLGAKHELNVVIADVRKRNSAGSDSLTILESTLKEFESADENG